MDSLHQCRWAAAVLLPVAIAWLSATSQLKVMAQESDWIIKANLTAENRPQIEFPGNASFYYILHSGMSVDTIREAVVLLMGEDDVMRFTGDPLDPPDSGTAAIFFRVSRSPVSDPGDVDGDGIDDLFEQQNPQYLDPFDPFDAFLDADGDGIANLEEYQKRSSLTEAAPTFILSTSPADGEDSVAVTRETILHFSQPLAETTVLDASVVFAEQAGEKLPARIHVSKDRRSISLFYNILPPSSRIRVYVDGDAMLDHKLNPVDADADGVQGGFTFIEFDTLTLTDLPNTAVCGRVFASELESNVDGTTFVNRPLEGVRVTVDGREEELFTVTDSNGDFRLQPAPAGRFFVHIDGRSATTDVPAGFFYPFVGKAWESIPEQEVTIGEIYLPLIEDGTLQPVNETETTVIKMAPAVLSEFPEFAEVSISVPPGALINDDGTSGLMAGISPVSPRASARR